MKDLPSIVPKLTINLYISDCQYLKTSAYGKIWLSFSASTLEKGLRR
jgi:hypothetical protein